MMVKKEHNKGVSKFWVNTDRQQRTQQHYHLPEKNGSDTTKRGRKSVVNNTSER